MTYTVHVESPLAYTCRLRICCKMLILSELLKDAVLRDSYTRVIKGSHEPSWHPLHPLLPGHPGFPQYPKLPLYSVCPEHPRHSRILSVWCLHRLIVNRVLRLVK